MDKQKKLLIVAFSVFGAFLAGILFLFSFHFSPLYCVEVWLEGLLSGDLFSYYTAQASLTFITISVMTVLSEKNVIIYWENIAESRLIKPTFRCFAAFSWYSIIANLGSIIGVFIKSHAVFSVFFAANIFVLILLTDTIIDVYYGKDAKKKKLIKELKSNYDNLYRDKAAETAYTEKVLGLQYRTRQVYREYDFLELNEIYDLYEKEYPSFNSIAAKPFTRALADSLDNKTSPFFLSMLENIVIAEEKRTLDYIDVCKNLAEKQLNREDAIKHFLNSENIATNENPYKELISQLKRNEAVDFEIWNAMVYGKVMKNWLSQVDVQLMHNREYFDFTRILKRRLVSVYNHAMAVRCLRKGCPGAINALVVKYNLNGTATWNSDGAEIDCSEILNVFAVTFDYMETAVHEDNPLEMMRNIVRDFYCESLNSPGIGFVLRDYDDFPIPQIMENWSSKQEADILELLVK